jgi:phosphoribosylformimino-5-aminoimidazole carboxamide ribotide isomerase
MKLFPAIDLFDKKAVRLFKGDYNDMTVYSTSPVSVALEFQRLGAENIHVVDLEGAKDGTTPNIDVVREIAYKTDLFVEIGGGIRSMDTLDRYFESGVSRAIIGTAAITDEEFLRAAIAKYGEKIAVGADVKDGYIAIKGWVEKSNVTLDEFFAKMQAIGVCTVICTDISKDGAMRGTNLAMYAALSQKYSVNIVASGGVSSIDDVKALADMQIYGAIIGKAYYTGAIDLAEALEVAGDN